MEGRGKLLQGGSIGDYIGSIIGLNDKKNKTKRRICGSEATDMQSKLNMTAISSGHFTRPP